MSLIHLPYLISCFTLLSMWLAGQKRREAWAIGIGNQALWIAWMASTAAWGFAPLSAALLVILCGTG